MSESRQPNVLIVMSDQHHAQMMSCAGHPVVRTPAMDRLAGNGVRLSNAYCNFPLCGPSRMSFLTGRYASDIGCLSNASMLRSDDATFAHAFSAGGYETVLAGRMHIVGPDQRHGFERRIIGDVWPTAYINRGWDLADVLGDLTNTTGFGPAPIRKSGPGRTGYQAYDEAVADTAANWLRQRGSDGSDRPFMLTVGFVTPHCPFVCPPEDYQRYDDQVSVDDLPAFDHDKLHPVVQELRRRAKLVDDPPTREDERRTRVAYYGLCSFTDRMLGRVLEALDAAGLADDTIVVYTSDHGEQLGEDGWWAKRTFRDASAGVPMIIAWPDRLPIATVATQNVSLLDLGNTLLDLAGLEPVPESDGRSFATVLRGDAGGGGDWHDEVIAENLTAGPDGSPIVGRMVRTGPWKFNWYGPELPAELYHMENDPAETTNLARDLGQRERVERLTTRVLEAVQTTPQAAVRCAHREERQRKIIARWQATDPLPEPDPPWYTEPIANWWNADPRGETA